MQPEQLRAARAALNWPLERLAEASGVHRNTISNFETRKYNGEPEKLAAVRRALEAAGVIFGDEGEEAGGARLRRFQRGDLVRFRPQTRVRFDYNIAADDMGEVVDVEPHPPATGPTYKIQVKFERALVPFIFRYEYELVQAAANPATQAEPPMLPRDPVAIIEEFCVVCTSARNDYDLYRSLFGSDPRNQILFTSIAPLCFGDMRRVMAENLFIQFCKITDPATTTGKKNNNLTTNFILEKISWPDAVAKKLRKANDRLILFRQYIEPARSKRIVHVDLSAQVERLDNLGGFPEGADVQFLQDLQTFINIAYGHFHKGGHWPIAVAMSTDTHQLVRALEKAVVFDRCTKCNAGESAEAVLDHEDRSD
jgi:transcriptional regulator with XRE-family HTH domain